MDGPIVQCHPDGRVVYRASALGGCDLALLAARLEYEAIPPPTNLQKAYDRGQKVEPIVLDMLRRDRGWQIVSPQREVELPLTSKISVVGHTDGETWESSPGRRVVEVKSQSELEWKRFATDGWDGGFFPKYKWQLSAYMLALDLPAFMVRALWDGEKVADIDVIEVAEPFYTLEDIRRRVLRIEAAAATGVLLADCTSDYGCPYFYLHEEVDRELVTDVAIGKLAHEYEDARRERVVADGKMKVARRALREGIDGDKVATEDGTKVTFYMASNPPQLNKERLEGVLKIAGLSLADFQTVTKSERIRVTLPKDREDGDDGESGGMVD